MERNRNSIRTNASLCRKSLILMWSAVLKSSDSRASVTSLDVDQTLFLSTGRHERGFRCSDLWVFLLFILNYVLVQRVVHCGTGLWINPTMKKLLYCTSIIIYPVFDLLMFWFVTCPWSPGWKRVCLKCFRNKCDLTATTRHLQYCHKCLWYYILKEET